jgi:hypothetical protein
MHTAVSAIIYSISIGIVVIFQFGFAIGLPWGAASMGGKYPGKYPPKMRIVALVNMLVEGQHRVRLREYGYHLP